jgi:hypothetical protein
MRGFTTLLCSAALLAGLALAPAARAQIAIEIGVPPVCQWGYYEAAPYGCAPEGFYGPDYFFNGIFLGVGPWAGWGYGHGWGSHRYIDHGHGGNYHGRGGYEAEHGHYIHGSDDRGHAAPHGAPAHAAPHAAPAHAAPHAAPAHAAPHAAPAHAAPHGGGEPHKK